MGSTGRFDGSSDYLSAYSPIHLYVIKIFGAGGQGGPIIFNSINAFNNFNLVNVHLGKQSLFAARVCFPFV